MEDLDEQPSRFHELNNAIHAVAVTTAVIKANIDEQTKQSGRIESAVSSVNVRLDRFDYRMTEIEKQHMIVRSDLEKKIAEVRATVQSEVIAATSDLKDQTSQLKEQMALLSPIKLIVYGAVVMILTAVVNVWVSNAVVNNRESSPARLSAPAVVP